MRIKQKNVNKPGLMHSTLFKIMYIGHGSFVLSVLTRYLSEDTLTRIRSSPMRTFSPSDLCLDAGWIVHQQASPRGPENTQEGMIYDWL